MKKIYLILLFFIFSFQFCLAILEEEKISLKDAIEQALTTNPQVQILKLDVEISKNDIKTATRLQNPSFSTFQNMGKAGEENPQQVGVDYTYEILKRAKRKELAQSKHTSIENEQKFGESNLVLEVKKAYINFLLKKSNLKVIKEQQELSKEILDNAIKDSKLGKIPKSEVIQAKIDYNRAIMYTNIASSQVIYAQNRFNSVMNTSDINYDTKEDTLSDDYASLFAICPTNNSINFENIKNYALNNRFDLLQAKQNIITAQNNLKVTKSQLIPDLEVSGGYGYQIPSTSASGKYLSGAYVGVSLVNIPVLYQYKPEIKNAQLEIEKAQLKYKDTEIDIIRNVTDAWEKYSIAKETLIFYNKELLKNSKELIVASKKNLDNKEIDVTSFLISKKVYLELILGYQEALAEYYISYAELFNEIGAPYMTNSISIENL